MRGGHPSADHGHGSGKDRSLTGTQGNSCAVSTSTGNTAPNVTGATTFTIPKSTPFYITGAAVDLYADPSSIAVSAEIGITRSGTLHGIGGWFAATLSPTVTLSNSPLAANRIARRGVVFPVRRPTPLAAGDRVSVRMRILPADLLVSWSVRVFRGGAAEPSDRFDHAFHPQ